MKASAPSLPGSTTFLRAEHVLDAHPLAAERLQIMAERFLASALSANEAWGGSGDSMSSDADNEPLSAHDGGANTVSSAGLPSQMQRSSTVDHAQQGYFPGSAAMTPPEPNLHFPLSMSYDVLTQSTPENAGFAQFASVESVASNYYSMTLGSSAVSATPQARNEAFGRQLQRASIEAGWRLITMANPPAERYAAVFGFRLFFESRETILRRLRLFSEGPSQGEAVSERDDGLEHRIRILYPGFGREFFNADEVEAHLGRLGISIPQNAAFVEAEVSLGDLEEASTSWSSSAARADSGAYANLRVGSSDPMASRANGSPANAGWRSNGLEAGEQMTTSATGPDNVQQPTAPARGGIGTSGATGASFSPSMCVDNTLAPGRDWPHAKVAIDVNVLINGKKRRRARSPRAWLTWGRNGTSVSLCRQDAWGPTTRCEPSREARCRAGCQVTRRFEERERKGGRLALGRLNFASPDSREPFPWLSREPG